MGKVIDALNNRVLVAIIVGLILFLIPVCIFLTWVSWPFFALSYRQGEISGNAGGLIRWPVKLVLVAGFALLSLQGVSELIKRIAFLQGLIPDPVEKHKDPGLDIVMDVVEEGKK